MHIAAEVAPTPQITFPVQAQVGSVTISVDRTIGGYTLNTTALGQDLSAWCGHFADLKEALDEAGRIYRAFEAHRTADRIEMHAETLRRELATHQNRPQPMQDTARIGAIYTELAALEDLSTKRVRAALVAQLAHAA